VAATRLDNGSAGRPIERDSPGPVFSLIEWVQPSGWRPGSSFRADTFRLRISRRLHPPTPNVEAQPACHEYPGSPARRNQRVGVGRHPVSDLLGTTGPVSVSASTPGRAAADVDGTRAPALVRCGHPTVGHVLADAQAALFATQPGSPVAAPWRGSVPRVPLVAPQLLERPDKGQVVAEDVRLALGTVAEDGGGALPVGRHQKN
jgi:hypothetical protein